MNISEAKTCLFIRLYSFINYLRAFPPLLAIKSLKSIFWYFLWILRSFWVIFHRHLENIIGFSENTVRFSYRRFKFNSKNYFDRVLSFRVFGPLSSSSYSQRFGQYVFRPSSGVYYRARESTRNFEPCSLFNPRGSLALIPLNLCGYKVLSTLVVYSSAV